jgi:hypothetical protein
LIRQCLDDGTLKILGGFYDLDNIEFKYLEDLTIVVAMGPPS